MEDHSASSGIGIKIRSFFLQSKRVWHILRKPTRQEFKSIAKISALGIGAIGIVGFVIADIMKLFG